MSAPAVDRPSVRSTRHLGSVPRAGGNDWLMFGQDGGQSIDLADATLFVFSDTLLVPRGLGLRPPLAAAPNHSRHHGHFLANTAGVSSDQDLRSALASLDYFVDARGWPQEILCPSPQERLRQLRFWPAHGVQIGGEVFLFYLGIECTKPGFTWGFRNVGTGLAKLDPSTGSCQRLLHEGSWRFWPPYGDDFHFGVQVMEEGGWIYVYASLRRELFCTARLARVAAADIAEPAAYEYLASPDPTWTQDLDRAQDMGPCSSEYSVSFNRYLSKYVLSYVDAYDKSLVLRIADRLWGPFGPPMKLARLPHRDTSEMVYLGFEHPAFADASGRTIFLSYCQPDFALNSLVAVTFA